MTQFGEPTMQTVHTGLTGSYFRLAIAVLMGAGLALGIYFAIPKDTAGAVANQQVNPQSGLLCVCPGCGAAIDKPAGLDCEEVNCPHCGNAMNNGAMFPAAAQTPSISQNPAAFQNTPVIQNTPIIRNPGAIQNPPLTQNRRETLAEQGIATMGPMTQNQRETLAEQNIGMGQNPTPMTPIPSVPNTRQQLVAAQTLVPAAYSGFCACPSCKTTVVKTPGVPCSQTICPKCHSVMTNGISVGASPVPQNTNTNTNTNTNADVNKMQLAAVPQTPPCQGPAGGVTQPCPHTVARTTPCPHTVARTTPCPMGSGGASVGAPNTGKVENQTLTYTNTIEPIITQECLRCHGGPLRNLSTYNNLKTYVDSGLLMMMVQPGGPMSRFLSADEFNNIETWIKAGAPR